ncbi:hypothetical protein KY311_01465, partial [Candidatus Woesearchaeota archaeon]|nr:hypothetical protein [Candidatus Woesearchaeota archaeon]
DQATFLIDNAQESSLNCGDSDDTTNCCITMDPVSDCKDITLETFPRITLGSGETEVMKVIISAHPRANKDSYSVPIHVEAPQATVPFDKTIRLLVVVR